MTPKPYSDEEARKRIQTALDETLIVEAAAGTGKTHELVHRIVAVLRAGRARVDGIVAVTFTHKAAGELKVRLRQELDEARQAAQGGELDHLEDALKRLEEAAIGTIHSFCAQILRERPVEARIDPSFQDLPEQEQRRLYERAFDGWFQQALDESRPGLRRALTRLAWNSSEGTSPAAQLQRAGWSLIEWRDCRALWRRRKFDREGQIDALVLRLKQVAGLSAQCQKPGDELFRALAPVRELATWIERADVRPQPDYDTLEGRLVRMLREVKKSDRKGRGSFAPGVSRDDMLAGRTALILELEEFAANADADLAALLQADLQDLIDRYDALKQRTGKLDFVDLLLKVRELIRDNPDVRHFLQDRYTHIFVDEFQDTDPLQAEVLLLLSAGDGEETDWRNVRPLPGKLFVVGDPKQSIYRFRRADVCIYQDVRDRLLEHGAILVHLTTSYRALRPIQQCVNAAFRPIMQEDRMRAQAGYVPLEGGPGPEGEQPSVIVIPVPRPWGYRKITKKAIDESLPGAIVGFIEWLLKSGWTVRNPEDHKQRIPIEARHIAVLFRRFLNYGDDIARAYVRDFEARDIQHLLVGSKSFHQREEVETLRAGCQAIEWPSDELAVYATLRGPLFAFHDETLLRYRVEVGHLHPLRPSNGAVAGDLQPVARALEMLADLHRNRNRRPVADTLNLLLEATRSHVGFAFRPGGHQVLSNVYRVVELARGFEQTGGISFRGFVDELVARAERYDSAEAPMIEESADGVRMLTVHSAKGLEFPVVILADLTANLAAREPQRYVDPVRGLCAMPLLWCVPWELREFQAEEKAREESEGVRIAYVAATRARDLLVVPAVGDQEWAGWLQPLNKAIYPPLPAWRKSRPVPGCPQFGDATVLARPPEFANEPESSVRPGLHVPQEGEHKVVWWDPGKLRLNVDAKLGLRTFDLLREGSGAGAAAYARWRENRQRVLALGAIPSREVFNPSEIAEAPGANAIPLTGLSSRPPGDRPSGLRFGTLVHNIIRDAGFDAASVQRFAHVHGRALGATIEEVESARVAVLAALDHPLLERARTATQCHRELPIALRLSGNQMVEGVIDLAFLEEGAWHIVDFKTDAHLPARHAQYERQLRWYALALSTLTGQTARGYLLAV